VPLPGVAFRAGPIRNKNAAPRLPRLNAGLPSQTRSCAAGIEPQERHLLGSQLLRAHRGGLQPVEAMEDFNRSPPSGRVRPAIHVLPAPGDVGPHGQLKALNQPVIPRPPKTSRK
jgi:hypothetical protein